MEAVEIPDGTNLFDPPWSFNGVCEVRSDMPATWGWNIGPWHMLAVPLTPEDREGLRRTGVLRGNFFMPGSMNNRKGQRIVFPPDGQDRIVTVAFVDITPHD